MIFQGVEMRPWQETYDHKHGADFKRALWAQPRLGKTLPTIKGMLDAHQHCNLVIAPATVCPFWAQSLEHAGFDTLKAYKYGSERVRKELHKYLHSGPYVVVLNYSKVSPLQDVLRYLKPGYLVLDESHFLSGIASAQAIACRSIAYETPYVRELTGTPAANHLGSLWGQMVALDRDDWGRKYSVFAKEFLEIEPVFGKVTGYYNLDALQAKINRYATVVRRTDVFGPDQTNEIYRTIELPSKVVALYKRLAKEWIDDELDVDVAHTLKRLTRLQQVASGFIPGDDGEIHDLHTAKIDAVLGDLGEIFQEGEKVVLFHRFRWESKHYSDAIRAKYPNVPLLRIAGDVPVETRNTIVDTFRSRIGSIIAVIQTQSGGVGIDFASAQHAMFVSQSFSYVQEEQARDRIFSPGEVRTVSYYRAADTVDLYIAKILAAKQNVGEVVRNVDRESAAFGSLEKKRK